MNKQNKYISVENIPFDIKRDTIFDIKTKSVNYLTHSFHKYPGKFIPQIPDWAINKYTSKNNLSILDPFCGSGTTLVESLLHNHNAIGIDIDPLSVLISKVKTTPLDIEKLTIIKNWVTDKIKDKNIKQRKIPKIKTLNHWFTDDAIDKLGKIRFIIDEIPNNFSDTKDIQDFLYICFSSIIRKVSNADNQSQKTYVSHTNPKIPDEVFSSFSKQLELYFVEIIEFSKKIKNVKAEIINNSSTIDLKTLLNDKVIDLIITSPPYIKAIDYIYNQMVELFWIGDLFDIETQEKQNERKKSYVGNKQLKKSEYAKFIPKKYKTNFILLDSSIQKIFETDKKNGHKHSYITWKFFNDMENHFKEISSVMRPKVHYVMVVGNSKVSNIEIDTANILIEIAKKYNLNISNKWGYKIKNRYMRFDRKGRGGKINIDWVLDFEKE
tara:strand:+ start:12604 stop:13917 length:1314 start_codon:yes stop_codon:yes gene_type:complete